MNRIQSILLVTAAAFSVNIAYAQSPVPDTTTGTPSGAAPEARIVTTTTDPLVQKRNDDAMANQQYKAHKKQYKAQYKESKAEYKQRVDGAKLDRKQFKQDATQQEKSAMAGETPAAPLEALPTTKQ